MLSVDRLCKTYGEGKHRTRAIHDVTLEVPDGTIFTLLGPSGCGKTTMLRCVAGLESADAGVIVLGGRTVTDPARGVHVPPHRRGLGMVFQSPTVWPHMCVYDNVAFPLVSGALRDRPSRAEVSRRVGAALELVRLGGLERRPATDLSGGQQQRLTLARALVREPRMLLLDEPLSALDARLREEIRDELRRIQSALRLTVLYVTHDRSEALALSHALAVVRDGVVLQVGPPALVYERPANAFVAELVGAANLLPGVVCGMANGRLLVETAHGTLDLSTAGRSRAQGDRVVVVARPETISLDEDGGGARVLANTFLGDTLELVVHDRGRDLRVRLPPREGLAPGSAVRVRFDTTRLAVLGSGDDAR